MYSKIVNSADDSDAPRSLTESEIDFILTSVPHSDCPYRPVRECLRDQIVETLRTQLYQLKLSPSQIPAMKEEIIKAHMKAIIDRGTPVGMQAAESTGNVITQMILNSFHSSGRSEAASGIDGVKDGMLARVNISNPLAVIHFKDENVLPIDIVAKYREMFVEVFVRDTVESFDIEIYKGMPSWVVGEVPFQTVCFLRVKFKQTVLYQHKISLRMLNDSLYKDQPIPGTPSNRDIIESHYSSMRESEIIVLLKPNAKYTGAILQDVSFRDSPVESVNHVDAGDDERYDMQMLVEMTTLRKIADSWFGVRLRGIPGIKNLRPAKTNATVISVIVKSQEKLADGKWKIRISEQAGRESGMRIEKVRAFMQSVGFKIHESSSSHVVVSHEFRWKSPDLDRLCKLTQDEIDIMLSTPDYPEKLSSERKLENGWYYRSVPENMIGRLKASNIPVVTGDKNWVKLNVRGDKFLTETWSRSEYPISVIEVSPSEIASSIVKLSDNIFDQYRFSRKAEVVRPRSSDMNRYVYGIADINIKDIDVMKRLLAMDEVNPYKTYCNSMHIIAHTLGIEASLIFNYINMTKMIHDKRAYVNSANIITIVESISNRGVNYGATFNGIGRQNAGHLSLCAVEKAGDVLLKAAVVGQKESLQNSTAAIFLGVRASVGTGYSHVHAKYSNGSTEKNYTDDQLAFSFMKDARMAEVMERQIRRAQEKSNLIFESIREPVLLEDEDIEESIGSWKAVDPKEDEVAINRIQGSEKTNFYDDPDAVVNVSERKSVKTIMSTKGAVFEPRARFTVSKDDEDISFEEDSGFDTKFNFFA